MPLIHPAVVRRHRARIIAFGLVAFVLLLFTVVVPATGPFEVPEYTAGRGETSSGVVREVIVERTTSAAGTVISERLFVEVDGEEIVTERSYIEGQIEIVQYEAGDRVLVTARETPEGIQYGISDRGRAGPCC